MTPWHCSIAVTSRGEFRTAHKSGIEKTHDLIEYNGRPYYFREKASVWDWEGVEFEFEYPKMLIVKAKPTGEGDGLRRLGEDGMRRVKELAKGFTPVITSGFAV